MRPSSSQCEPYDGKHLSMPRVKIVTEHRLIRQGSVARKIAESTRSERAAVGLGKILSLRDPPVPKRQTTLDPELAAEAKSISHLRSATAQSKMITRVRTVHLF